MQFNYAPIMTWMRYVQCGIWVLKSNPSAISEKEVIEKFDALYKNELVREANDNPSINPYKGIGHISVHPVEGKDYMGVVDNNHYLSTFYNGIYGSFANRRLCFNKNLHGFNGEYFKYLEKEDGDYIFMERIANGSVVNSTPNIKRLINILFMRQQPFYESFSRKDIAFLDYNELERKAILDECRKY